MSIYTGNISTYAVMFPQLFRLNYIDKFIKGSNHKFIILISNSFAVDMARVFKTRVSMAIYSCFVSAATDNLTSATSSD